MAEVLSAFVTDEDFINSFFNTKIKHGFPGGTVNNNPPANAGVMDSIPDPGRFHMPRSK